jgi:hypothetical protein
VRLLLHRLLLGRLLVLDSDWTVNDGSHLHETLELPSLNSIWLILGLEDANKEMEEFSCLLSAHGSMEVRLISLHNSIESELRYSQNFPIDVHD